MYKVLVINPGSTSTELSLFEDEIEVLNTKIVHPVAELRKCERVIEQFPLRNNMVKSALSEWGIKTGELSAVVGRSGPPVPESGVFEVNQQMVDVVKSEKVRVEHPAILGCLLAKEVSDEFGIQAFVSYPPPIEWPQIAKVSGIPEIERRLLYHRQNIDAVAILAANDVKKDLNNVRLVIAHLEGGMSIVAFEGGQVIDTTSAMDEGPFTMERSGSLPANSVVELCFSGKYTKQQVLKKIRGEGGMVAFLGINKISDVEDRIDNGDKKAEFYLKAMCYQIAKEIGAMATVLKGQVDAIVLTGKILDSKRSVNWIKERVESIAAIITYPEQESIVFAKAGLSVLRGEEKAKKYNG